MRPVKASWLVSIVALGAVVALGARYRARTDAVPSSRVIPAIAASTAPSIGSAASVVSAATAPQPGASVAEDAAIANPERARLEARRQLYESVDALLQASQFEQARRLLDQDAERYGDDLAPEWRDLEQSYRLLADCGEHPSTKLRVRAEAFVQVSEAASLKSRILTACAPKR
jgi:hypothetical protein